MARRVRYVGAVILIPVLSIAGCPVGIDAVPWTCKTSADCLDDNPCITHECDTTKGECVNKIDDTLKPPGGGELCVQKKCEGGQVKSVPAPPGMMCSHESTLTCDGMGHCEPCATNANCGQDTFCRHFICKNSECVADDKPDGTDLPDESQVQYDCKRAQCDGMGGPKEVSDSKDVPIYNNDCVDHVCDADNMHQKSQSPTGKQCQMATDPSLMGVCDAFGKCVACLGDGEKNGQETGIDCGEACGNMKRCEDGQGCKSNADCQGMNCSSSKCICGDTKKNNGEAGVDCGAECPKKCDDGTSCSQHLDCASGHCIDDYCCETDCPGDCYSCAQVDQPGTCMPLPAGSIGKCASSMACGPDQMCKHKLANQANCDMSSQCASGHCASGKCRQAIGSACTANDQCASLMCDTTTTKKCVACDSSSCTICQSADGYCAP